LLHLNYNTYVCLCYLHSWAASTGCYQWGAMLKANVNLKANFSGSTPNDMVTTVAFFQPIHLVANRMYWQTSKGL